MSGPISHAGRWLLNRRQFLRFGGTGLSGVALATLLAEERLLRAAVPPIRPQFRIDNPLAPRAPHFKPAAKRVLLLFCSGALSHIDSWDYKPELIRRHGEPL